MNEGLIWTCRYIVFCGKGRLSEASADFGAFGESRPTEASVDKWGQSSLPISIEIKELRPV
ncbi:MAG TPA: hypothetical protein DD381_03300 [Lentisphaeria bacterium]|nr:MAG: hypothetical protein A2X47_02950 [Lentisphaerae bacterium GWF2_38_69]HBM15359.1 hypothetical protein [Lentisphaeria bacterium]